MNDFSLSPFLATLADDFRITVRDYERIAATLRAGGPWSVRQLRDALLALLAKNEEQADLFLRRFKAFFRLDLDRPFPELDVERALRDLDQLAKGKEVRVRRLPPPQSKPAPKYQPEPSKKIAARIGLWCGVSLVVLILLIVGFWLWPSPLPSFSTDTLDFGEQPLDKTNSQSVTVTNRGEDSLFIHVEISGRHSDDFKLDQAFDKKTVLPRSSFAITVSFTSAAPGQRRAFLDIKYDPESPSYRVALKGLGIGQQRDLPSTRWRLYPALPHLKIQQVSPEGSDAWQLYASVACFILLAVFIYGFWLWRSHRVPEDREAYWEKTGPRHFRMGALGGKPAPRLSDTTLTELADSMGYYQSEEPGQILDIPASIEATGRGGGIPRLVFHRRKQIRSLLILEDALAEAATWNPIARELAEGMRKRGVPVLYGSFSGSLEQFRTEDGAVHHLEDLEDQRRGYLLLIFSDGRSLYREDRRFALRDLAHWPMVAWLELREQRFWDETSALPVAHGIPLYPATAVGTVQAVRRFLTEQSSDSDFSAAAIEARGAPSQAGTNLDAYLEQLLGDALIWAQDCAMLQPISPGLADGLRRRFHPRLPPERIERLYALPETTRNVSGLRFSDQVLRVLRTGFQVRRDERAQEAVLRFLLERIDAAEPDKPDEKNSLAHVAWEAVRERLRLELEADYDVKRLTELAKTPLGPAIEAELENVGLPNQPDKIPLRIRPRGKYALQRLARLGEGFNIPKLEAYPVARRHLLMLGFLLLAFVGFGGWSVYGYITEKPPPGVAWQMLGPQDMPALLKVREGDEWRVEGMGSAGTLTKQLLEEGKEYRLVLYGGGHKTEGEIKAESGKLVQVIPEEREGQRLCREALPETGVTVQICPDEASQEAETVQIALWRERLDAKASGGRRLSVGLEIYPSRKDAPELRRWRDRLLSTGSVDLIYLVDRATEETLAHIQQDLGPLVEQSQLIVWAEDPGFIGENTAFFSAFDAAFNVSRGQDLAWVAKLEEIFGRGKGEIISGEEIELTLGKEKTISGDVVLVTTSAATKVDREPIWREPVIGMEFVYVPGDCFQMGSPTSEEGRYDDEVQHEVCVDGFWMGKIEVTNAQYRFFKEDHDSEDYQGHPLNGDNQPAVNVSWEDAKAYSRWLSKQGEHEFGLPTEAEWEYACRAGTTTARYWGESPDQACRYASVFDQGAKQLFPSLDWTAHNCNDDFAVTAPVESFEPNDFGLNDMLGNVWEWVEDVYSEDAYRQYERDNPIYIRDGPSRVLRGGGWVNVPRSVRCAYRDDFSPGDRRVYVGFRLRRKD